jgi:hypothetical protein
MAEKHATDTPDEIAAEEMQFTEGDAVVANAHAPVEYRGRNGIVTENGPGMSEFRVEFNDGQTPTTGYLRSSWLRMAR